MQRLKEGDNVASVDVKQWLWRYREAKIDFIRQEGEYREYRETILSTSAINYDAMPRANSGSHDIGDILIRQDKELSKLMRTQRKMELIYDEIRSAIDKLTDKTERAVLSLRYLQMDGPSGVRRKTWEEISVIIDYGCRQTQNIHGEALQHLAEVIK